MKYLHLAQGPAPLANILIIAFLGILLLYINNYLFVVILRNYTLVVGIMI